MVSFACDITEKNEITKISLLVYWGGVCLLLSDGGSSYLLISN